MVEANAMFIDHEFLILDVAVDRQVKYLAICDVADDKIVVIVGELLTKQVFPVRDWECKKDAWGNFTTEIKS